MRIVWGDGARLDFSRIITFLDQRSPAAARRIGDRILAAVALLERFPEIAPASSRHRGLRQLVVTRSPYLVIYRVHAQNVEIRAVVHAKQRRRR
jgi:toxin ParE1/3/4